MITKLLLLGCGDIAIRLSKALSSEDIQCFGMRRDITKLPEHITGIEQDFSSPQGLTTQINQGFDIVVMTLVPADRSESAYHQIYVDGLERIMTAMEEATYLPKLVIFVSSTSVYAQNHGEWVSEQSPTEPTRYSGQAIASAEARISRSTLPSCVVRFSGIYGPGRRRLIQQVIDGDRGEKDLGYSNRIHADDCAGVLAHLIKRHTKCEPLEKLYLATDSEPVKLKEVKQWLANVMGLNSPPVNSKSKLASDQKSYPQNKNNFDNSYRNNKRCSNKQLLNSGYQFRYPTFREGYTELLKEDGLLKVK
ncbi:sugar nucleotide-binding protein [Aurantivibrio infirmus]